MTNNVIEPHSKRTRTKADHWGPEWLQSPPSKAPQNRENKVKTEETEPAESLVVETPELPSVADQPAEFTSGRHGLTEYRDSEIHNGKSIGDNSDNANEFYWANIDYRDHRYLTGPRRHPEPCLWCGGRYKHSWLCDALHASWGPPHQLGKHKALSRHPRSLWSRGSGTD